MGSSRPEKIILDIDNALTIPVQDTDDAMALALVSPELDLLGCTTCAGNCRTWQSTVNTLRMLEVAGVYHLPVAAGSEAPFQRDREAHFRYLEAKSAGSENKFWGENSPLPAPTLLPSEFKAHEFMIHTIRSFPSEVSIICLGSFTNLALALVKDPDIAGLVKRIVHMGGAFESGSGSQFTWQTPDIPDAIWQSTLRFNTAFDPEASAVVFQSSIPITLVTANVTTRVFQYRRDVDRLLTVATPLHRFLHLWGMPWVDWSVSERQLPGAHMHDPLTLSVLISPDFCRLDEMYVNVPPLLDDRSGWLQSDPGGVPVQAAVDVDADRFESFLAERLVSPVLEKYRAGPH